MQKVEGKIRDINSRDFRKFRTVFTGFYLHYKDVPWESEESIAERTKLRRQRFDEIANKEKMIDPKSFKKYFEYLRPSDMYKNLSETIGSKINEAQVNAIKDNLADLMELFKSKPTSNEKRIRNKNNMLKIAEGILEYNEEDQKGGG